MYRASQRFNVRIAMFFELNFTTKYIFATYKFENEQISQNGCIKMALEKGDYYVITLQKAIV